MKKPMTILFDQFEGCTSNYTVQCQDVISGVTGDFLFDIPHYQATGKFKAISPVFKCLQEFHQWCAAHGSPHRDNLCIERMPCNSPS